MQPPLPFDDLDDVCQRTKCLWDEARGRRVFLTGGTGFFGIWLVESFLRANELFNLDAKLTVLTRSPDAFLARCPHLAAHPALTLLPGDVRNFEFPAGEFPFVIHAATEASARQAADEPLEMFSTIVDGTRRVLDFAVTHGKWKFLLTSSGAVSETGHLLSANVYGEGKRMAEHLCALYAKMHGLDCKIARGWAFVGPGLPLDQHFAIGNFIRDAMAGAPIQIGGDGTPTRSYMYASDLAVWLWTILFKGPSLVPLNVGSGEEVTIRGLAEAVTAALQPGLRIDIARAPEAGAPRNGYVPDVSEPARLLGLKTTVSLPDAIRRTAAWHQRWAQ